MWRNPKQDGIILFNNAVGVIYSLFNDIAIELIKTDYSPKKIEEFFGRNSLLS